MSARTYAVSVCTAARTCRSPSQKCSAISKVSVRWESPRPDALKKLQVADVYPVANEFAVESTGCVQRTLTTPLHYRRKLCTQQSKGKKKA